MASKTLFLERWERNRKFVSDFKILFENYLNKTNTWSQRAFIDSPATNEQYLITLKQVSELEYSDAQYEGLKKMEIHENALADYVKNLDVQYDNLKFLHDEIQKKAALL